jgi:hypothetical protein
MNALRTIALVAAALLLTGCGFEVSTKPDELTGKTIAARANRQLERQNPDMTPGDLTCRDVKYEEDATTRCVRTVVFDDGRLVRIGATVTIESTEGDGRFNIQVDDEAQGFGLTGASVFAELAKKYEQEFGTRPTGSCPAYLRGVVGQTMTCTLETTDGELEVLVEVTDVKPETYETQYTYRSR